MKRTLWQCRPCALHFLARLATYAAASMMLISGAATAQNADSTTVLDLRETISRTLTTSPDLRASGYLLRAQEARILQTSIKPPPELSVQVENVLGTGEHELFESAQTTLSVAWILERGVRQRQVEAESANLKLMEVDMDVSRLDAAAQTARRYLDCLALQTRMVNALAAITQAETTVSAVTDRVEAGAVPAAELARAQAELARRELVREDIEHELLSAYYLLAAQWGQSSPDFGSVSGDVLTLPQIEDFAVLKEQLGQNPDIARYLSQQRLFEAQLSLAEATRKPNLRVSAGLRQLENVGDQTLVFEASMPLARPGNNQGRLNEARANIARTEAEAEAERVRIETALFVIYQELQHSIMLAGVLRDEIIPLYEDALTQTQNAYEQGRYSFLELSTVQAELLAARNDLVDASIEAHRRVIEIERYTGLSIQARGL
jgi:outer membrane protein, heavy metal efflux system